MAYLPLIERKQKWADRTKSVMFPLFPGYILAQFRLSELGQVLSVSGLVSVVRVNGYPTPVRAEEVESVRTLMAAAGRLGIEPAPVDFLMPGSAIAVSSGPFQGMRGTLLESRGKARVIVRLTAIRQAVSVDLDRHVLKSLQYTSVPAKLVPRAQPGAAGRRRV